MEENNTTGLKEQRDRRKRINRIKIGIIASIFIWMLVSMIVCVTLLVKVYSLERRISQLTLDSSKTFEVSQEENQTPNFEELDRISTEQDDVQGDILFLETEQVLEDTELTEDQISSAVKNVMGTSDPLNKAEEGDTLKVYLTFDDGPSSNTPRILDILEEYDVKATFFVVGRDEELFREHCSRIVEEGHTLAMHSYTHKYSEIYESLDGFKQDLDSLQQLLYDVTGEECKMYRFPGGSSNQVSNRPMQEFISYLNEQGITYYDLNVYTGDATSQAYTAN